MDPYISINILEKKNSYPKLVSVSKGTYMLSEPLEGLVLAKIHADRRTKGKNLSFTNQGYRNTVILRWRETLSRYLEMLLTLFKDMHFFLLKKISGTSY